MVRCLGRHPTNAREADSVISLGPIRRSGPYNLYTRGGIQRCKSWGQEDVIKGAIGVVPAVMMGPAFIRIGNRTAGKVHRKPVSDQGSQPMRPGGTAIDFPVIIEIPENDPFRFGRVLEALADNTAHGLCLGLPHRHSALAPPMHGF